MYFGITSRSLKERFTEHKQNAKTKKNKLYKILVIKLFIKPKDKCK